MKLNVQLIWIIIILLGAACSPKQATSEIIPESQNDNNLESYPAEVTDDNFEDIWEILNDPSLSLAIEILPFENMEVYTYHWPYPIGREELLIEFNDEEFITRWNDMLASCLPHRRNHPEYTDHYLVVAYHENQPYYFELTVDADDKGEVDMAPLALIEENDVAIVQESGLYRCEGLKDIVAGFNKD